MKKALAAADARVDVGAAMNLKTALFRLIAAPLLKRENFKSKMLQGRFALYRIKFIARFSSVC